MQQPDVLSSATTGELVYVAQSGGPDASNAVTRLLMSHEKMIAAIVRSRCPMAPHDEDILQIGRMAFVEAINRFRVSRGLTLSTFAHSVVSGRIVNEIVRRNRRSPTIDIHSLSEEHVPAAADVFESRLEVLLLRVAVGQMPARDRELLTRLYERDGSQSAVARDLGVSQQAVQKRQHRILNFLHAAVHA